MEKMLAEMILHPRIYYHYNIVLGHTKVKVNWKRTILTSMFQQVAHEKVEYYFFYFDHKGMALYQYENFHFIGDIVFIDWDEIQEFQTKKHQLEIEISFIFKGEKFHMMLARFQRHQLWIEENINYLLENDFFYEKKELP